MLFFSVGSLLLVSFSIGLDKLWLLLRRTRWVLISVFLIYAYSNPGELLLPRLGILSPVSDGMMDGVIQLSKLVGMLSGLSVILSILTPSQLIAGLYVLFVPLSLLGISRERAAVRLALVLRYAETEVLSVSGDWRSRIEKLLAPAMVEPGYIELHVPQFSLRDLLVGVAGLMILLGTWITWDIWI